MKGIINKGLQEFVLAEFGADAWEAIKKQAGCQEPFFSAIKDYPDSMTMELVQAASKVAQLPEKTILIEFGKFWVPNTGLHAYPHFFQLAGTTAREFLLNMDKVHQHVTHSILNAKPPRFEYEPLPNGNLRILYRSSRQLCTVLHGLILGVGLHFGEKLEVKELACQKRGDAACIMEVSFHDQ